MIPTAIIHVDPGNPNDSRLRAAADMLRDGKLVVFPTETVYGIGANALDAKAVERIYLAKGRPPNNPLIVHLGDRKDLVGVTSGVPASAEILTSKFWPGPLTLVLPKNPRIPAIVTAGGPTIAVRIPAHPIARRLIQLAGVPVAAPSANRSGELSPTRAEHVAAGLGGLVDLIIDAGPTQVGLESTVLDLTTDPPRLLRPGQITPAQIEAEIGPIVRREIQENQPNLPLHSPGLLSRHYAPRTRTECVENGRDRINELLNFGYRVGWLAFTPQSRRSSSQLEIRIMPPDSNQYAAALYATLHELDQLGLDRIVVDLPPATDEWLAVRDRLMRASAQED
jgi:L-threonylcarbamoyladenylate synthase